MKLSTFLAFAGGIAAGVALGLLLAPDSGVNTRQKIAQLLKEKGLSYDKESFDNFVSRVISKLRANFTDEDLDAMVDEVAAEK